MYVSKQGCKSSGRPQQINPSYRDNITGFSKNRRTALCATYKYINTVILVLISFNGYTFLPMQRLPKMMPFKEITRADQASEMPTQVVELMTGPSDRVRPIDRKPYDHTITFEEYNYYAQRTREVEKTYAAPGMDWKALLSKKEGASGGEAGRVEIADEEWVNANRALRMASCGSCW